ncbi:MAG: hypothetical protein K2H01_08090 [Ruminococcus sp.]|nr:hypothetical protein [Ruminococcus sp.]
MGKKKKSINALADGIKAYEDKKKDMQDADFTDLGSFRRAYLNEPDPKRRRKLAEEYKKRHAELAAFLDENGDLVSSETKISSIIQSAASGIAEETDNAEVTNLFEKIREGLR